MTIPDVRILEEYVLTLSCGHKRRTTSPCQVGDSLPCLNKVHELQPFAITYITDRHGEEHDRIGWLDPQAAIHGSYHNAKTNKEKKFWGKVLRGWISDS